MLIVTKWRVRRVKYTKTECFYSYISILNVGVNTLFSWKKKTKIIINYNYVYNTVRCSFLKVRCFLCRIFDIFLSPYNCWPLNIYWHFIRQTGLSVLYIGMCFILLRLLLLYNTVLFSFILYSIPYFFHIVNLTQKKIVPEKIINKI